MGTSLTLLFYLPVTTYHISNLYKSLKLYHFPHFSDHKKNYKSKI